MYILLRRTIIVNNTGVGSPYVATNEYFDTTTRKPLTQQVDSQVNDPSELAKDAEVYRYDVRPGLIRLVLYNGNGSVYTKNLKAASSGIGTGLALKLMPVNAATTDVNARDACFDFTGQFGVPPYQLEVTGQYGQAAGYYRKEVSQLEIYPVRFYNLANGEYFLKITDQTGDFRTQVMQVEVAPYGYPTGAVLQDTITAGRLFRRWWRYNQLDVWLNNYSESQGNGDYTAPYGTLVDAFLLPGSNGTVWRQVYAAYQTFAGDPRGSVYFVDTSTQGSSKLALHNLILFNPDSTAEQNGGAIVEAQDGVAPLQFALTGPGPAQTNATGQFEGLAGGAYEVAITDAMGAKASASFVLEDRYRLWLYLDYFDLDSTPLRAEFWRRDWDGPASPVLLSGEPIIVKSDGLSSSLGGQGDVPAVVGTSLEINVLADIDLFEEVVIGDDRNCRVDFYYRRQLHFRGYLTPDIYTAPLLDGLQPVSLTATDGLADLKDIDMRGHIGQRLGGHWPVLNTLLHCLSRTQISLPLQVFTNRRDAAMASLDAPELVTTTNRAGYWDDQKGTPATQRTVVDALAQLLGGTLVQRQGSWQLRSALEAALDAPGRAYYPAGTSNGEVVALAPSGTVVPSDTNCWHWLDDSQTKQRRAGWKYLLGSTDVGWAKNSFWQGEVFSDPDAWLSDASKLRGITGWQPAPGQLFPVVLQRVGEKGKDHSSLWPRSTNSSRTDGRYLESPALPLAAGLEGVPAYLSFTGKLVPEEYYLDYDGASMASPTTAPLAYLPYEVVVDGHPTGVKLAEFKLVAGATTADTTFEIRLAGLPSGSLTAVLRVYSWQAPDTNLAAATNLYFYYQDYKKGDVVSFDRGAGKGLEYFVARRDQKGTNPGAPPAVLLPEAEWATVAVTNLATGQLLLTRVGVQLRPQEATWDGEDNFRADGPGGNIRPTETLVSYHADVPISAGLYAGNLQAFDRGTGLTDGTMTTSWSRSLDKDASPLLEANVYDQLALRENPSYLVPGKLRHNGIAPPFLLDSVDTPYDLPGRRFFVAASEWYTMAATSEVSLIEIGVGADAQGPAVPVGGRLLPQLHEYAPGKYAPYVRVLPGGGLRVVAG